MAKWKVLDKHSDGLSAWEISICAEMVFAPDPTFGAVPHHEESWGWFSPMKLPFSDVQRWMTRDLDAGTRAALHDEGLRAAQRLAAEMTAANVEPCGPPDDARWQVAA